MRCAILCGGKGTRLGTHAGDLPKALVPIGGVPLIARLIGTAWSELDIRDFDLLVGHRADEIVTYVNDAKLGVRIRCHRDEGCGTAGALRAVLTQTDDVLVLYGDVMIAMDLRRLIDVHVERRALATLVVHPNDHPQDSDLVECDPDGRITAMYARPHASDRDYPNMVSAGVHVLSSEMTIPADAIDLSRDVFPPLVSTGRVHGYETYEYLRDVGTPERYDSVCDDWVMGRIIARRRSFAHPAVFLDRDGVINGEIGGVRNADELIILPGVSAAIRRLNRAGYLVIVVTNQPMIAKGQMSWDDLAAVHLALAWRLGFDGAWLDGIYVCPHHPDAGFPGEVAELKCDCECRKPNPGMIHAASARFNIDLGRSFLVGDSVTDIACANRAGVMPLNVRTNQGEATATSVFKGLPDAVDHILTRRRIIVE